VCVAAGSGARAFSKAFSLSGAGSVLEGHELFAGDEALSGVPLEREEEEEGVAWELSYGSTLPSARLDPHNQVRVRPCLL